MNIDCKKIFSMKLILLVFFLSLMHFGNIAAEPVEPQDVRQILLLNSYNQEMTWVKDILRAVYDAFLPAENKIVLHVENMDSKTFFSESYFDSLRKHYEIKYNKLEFSLILCSDNNAYDFLRRYRDELFPGVPVIFCGVNDFDEEQIASLEDFVGIAERISARSTVELIRELHPETDKLFIINDYLTTGRAWTRDIQAALKDLEPGLQFQYSENLSIQQQLDEISGLEEGTIVLLGVYFSDRDGFSSTYEQIGAMLAGASQVPVYCLLEFNIGKGVIGGDVISGYYQGQAMAELGMNILSGADAEESPLLSRKNNKFFFNYFELERFSIDQKLLPGDSIIINKPFSFYETYKREIYSMIAVFLLMLAAIFGISFGLWKSRRAEEKLQDLRNYLADIINSMPSVLIGVDRSHHITQWNSEAESFTGITTDKASGKALSTAFPYMAEEADNIEKAIHSRRVRKDRREYYNDKGQKQQIEITIYPLKTKGYEGAVIRMDNITEKTRMEEMMIQSEKMLSVGGLAAGMAHEINNPLAAMIQSANVMAGRLGGGAAIAANEKAAAEAGTTIETIQNYMKARNIPNMLSAILESGRRVAEIVGNMLSFARKGEDLKSSHSLNDLIDKSLELAAADYDLKKHYDFKLIEIIKEYNEGLPMLSCEGAKIQQVFMNLLRNGAEAMQDGETESPRFIIRTGLDKTSNMIFAELEDNGPGMDDDTRRRVFEPFFTTKPEGVGTGLGLSVSYFIITKNHNGEMSVESRLGAGSKFIIRLPRLCN